MASIILSVWRRLRNTLKFRILNETRFLRDDRFVRHFEKHTAKSWSEYFFETKDELFEPMTQDEYDDFADELSKRCVFTSNVYTDDQYVGFVMDDGKILKYGKLLDEIVIYDAKTPNTTRTVTYYKLNHSRARKRYLAIKNKHYHREITSADDCNNR